MAYLAICQIFVVLYQKWLALWAVDSFIEVETEATTPSFTTIYNCDDKYYAPQRFFASKFHFLSTLDTTHEKKTMVITF